MSLESIRKMNDDYYTKTGRRKRMFSRTYGCQMNTHDSEKIKGVLSEAGYDPADNEKDADIIVYNTCCVRENAENRVYGNLGYLKNLKKSKPDLKIVVCGCMMQQETVIEKMIKAYRHVDVIFGTYNIHRFAGLLSTHFETGKQVIDVWKEHGEIVEDLPVIRDHPFKASVNIMYGCNNFCAYCIVPYVRGRERSRKPEEIVEEIKKLVADGVTEVTLLGQNVNSYGLGLEADIRFAGLLRQINEIEGLERIRFLTSHPKDLSDELIAAMRDCEKVCKHVHLPIQSGSNDVLKRMNRQYTREHYLELVNKMRAQMPDISITTDIIIGFPGEREKDFLDTLGILEQVRFSGAFTFIYSIRTGTPAATMQEQVPENIVKDRFDRMLNILNPLVLSVNEDRVGKVLRVLVDAVGAPETADALEAERSGMVTGRSDCNSIVHFRGNKSLLGQIVPVIIVGCKTFYLLGELQV